MFLRLLFTLLVALNIAVGAWLLWGQDDVHGRSATDPGVPELQLLSEQPVTTAAPVVPAVPSAAAAMPPVPPAGNSYRCIAVGPFANPQDLRNARVALAAPDTRMRSRQEQTTQARGWWVYLPATTNRAQALEQARRLAAGGIKDYFVVSSGDQPNTVSLGLFKDPANARKRRDEIVAAGFPAQMSERTETVPEYWLDLAAPANRTLDWRSRITDGNVGSHSTPCF
jgi:hypothetical protein